ncbi:MAG: response regulator [Planctomycetota bacterium]
MREGGSCRGARVLVAEDTPLGRKLIRVRLDVLGCRADFVENGKQAVEKVRENDYDVVLMDLMMPVTDGLAATRAIRESGKEDLPIIALTAAVTAEDREKARAAGLDDFLGKPIDPDQLEQKLMQWTSGQLSPALTTEEEG